MKKRFYLPIALICLLLGAYFVSTYYNFRQDCEYNIWVTGNNLLSVSQKIPVKYEDRADSFTYVQKQLPVLTGPNLKRAFDIVEKGNFCSAEYFPMLVKMSKTELNSVPPEIAKAQILFMENKCSTITLGKGISLNEHGFPIISGFTWYYQQQLRNTCSEYLYELTSKYPFG